MKPTTHTHRVYASGRAAARQKALLCQSGMNELDHPTLLEVYATLRLACAWLARIVSWPRVIRRRA